MLRAFLVAIVHALAPAAAVAQGELRRLTSGDVAVEHSAGYSWFSPGGRLGDVTHRRVYTTGMRRTRTVASSDRFALAYTAEWVPLIVVRRTVPSNRTCWRADTGSRLCRLDESASVAVGMGAAPFGAKLYLNRPGRWRAHVNGAAGAVLFSSEVPVYDSRQLNFTFEYGGALEIATTAHRDFIIGYKFHHTSNAGTAAFNPGLDANVVYVGVSQRRARAK